MDEFEWDEAKRAANVAKHRVDFTLAASVDWTSALNIPHFRSGEARFASLVILAHRVYVMVWTWRGGRKRIISLRKANSREVAQYEKSCSPDV